MQSNLLIVSDLHFGEDLLPGASLEKRRAVALGASAFCDFLRHHAQRRLDGRPWRLVVAGDLFDFMSVTLAAHRELPARNGDERWAGRSRSTAAGPHRMREIAEAHPQVLAAMVRFTAAGNEIDLIVGNHDLELLEEATAAELRRQLVAAARAARLDDAGVEAAVARVRLQPWFVYIPGVAWIEHGHVYDEACSSELNQAPFDPQSGELIGNVDHAAVRYLAQAAPELDPHGTEEWGFSGYLRYALGCGFGSFAKLIAGYVRFAGSLLRARHQHRSARRRRARYELHRQRVAAIAAAQGVELSSVQAIDRLARAPVTRSARRLFAMLMLDRWLSLLGGAAASLVGFALLPLGAALLVLAAAVACFVHISRRSAASTVGSQVPMLSVPERIQRLVEAPVVVFGHTHDPRRLETGNGGVYLNTGTWLPASRPGILRSFTHVLIRARRAPSSGSTATSPVAEIRQWRDGSSVFFTETEGAGFGAGVAAGRQLALPGARGLAAGSRPLIATPGPSLGKPSGAPGSFGSSFSSSFGAGAATAGAAVLALASLPSQLPVADGPDVTPTSAGAGASSEVAPSGPTSPVS
jgi:UDP-2,3-diacylglucosamine pyrophosphatase LpxH